MFQKLTLYADNIWCVYETVLIWRFMYVLLQVITMIRLYSLWLFALVFLSICILSLLEQPLIFLFQIHVRV